MTPGRLTGAFSDLTSVTVTNPLGINAVAGAIDGITQIAGFGILISAFLAGAAIIVRFRGHPARSGSRSNGSRSSASRSWSSSSSGSRCRRSWAIARAQPTRSGTSCSPSGSVTLLGGIPIACGVAILKYHLYDLDVVIRKAVVLGLLVVFISAVHAAIVGLLTTQVSSTIGSFAAAADPGGPVRAGEGPGPQGRRPPRLRQARDPVRGPGGLLRAGRRGLRRR